MSYYSDDHAVEDAVLTVINDGDGSQCGMTYQQRCQPFRLFEYVVAAKRYNPALTNRQARAAGDILLRYYEEHIAEMATA